LFKIPLLGALFSLSASLLQLKDSLEGFLEKRFLSKVSVDVFSLDLSIIADILLSAMKVCLTGSSIFDL